MNRFIIDAAVNIDNRPSKQEITDISQVSIGDLHGNALKLLFFLIHEGIAQVTDDDYCRIVQIYKNPIDALTANQLEEFNTIIAKMTILNRDILLRLIGDEVADRGNNDYFTLKLLEKLHQEQVPFEILVSNHGIGFIEAYESKYEFVYQNLGEHFARSLYNLQALVERKLVSRMLILELIDKAYKPALKAISYSLDLQNNKITLYSHAPIDGSVIKMLSSAFEVDFNDATIAELAHTIDSINQRFKQFVQENTVHTLYNNARMGASAYSKTDITNPLEIISWNRDYAHLDRAATHKGYLMEFVHGHDSTDTNERHVYRLDNLLGKTPAHHSGVYKIVVSNELLAVP